MTRRPAWPQAATFLLIGLGVSLRLRAYLADRSLWLDEAFLALNILDRDFAGLLRPLDNGQAAPVGFLFAQRLTVELFGNSELALRGVPVLASIASVIAFAWLAWRMLPPPAAVLALAMFAISDQLLHFAVEAKQYSSDVAIMVGVCAVFTALARRLDADDWGAWSLVTAVGAAAIWLSHPAILVIGGIAGWWLWEALRRRAWTSLLGRGVVAGFWVANFVALYLISIRFVSPGLHRSWRGATVPIVPASDVDVTRYYNLLWTLGVLPLGRQVVALVILAGVVGVVALWRCRSRQGAWFGGMLMLACVASSLGMFPVAVRIWLFFTPVMILLVAAGVDEMWRRTRHVFPALAPLVVSLLLLYPAVAAARGALQPREHEEIRPLLRHLERHRRDGDVLYVYREAQYAVRYYTARGFHFPGETLIGPLGDRYQAEADVERLRGHRRVWIVFSHVVKPSGLDEERLLLHLFDRVGVRLEGVRRNGAVLYLYDFSGRR